MPTDDSAQVPVDRGTREHRRWQIGIAISLFFGIFSAVMAYLSYASRPALRGAAPATPAATAPAPAEPTHGHPKGHGR